MISSAYRGRNVSGEYSERELLLGVGRRENARVLGVDGDKPYSVVSGTRGYEVGEGPRGYVQKLKGDYSQSERSSGAVRGGGAIGKAIRI